MTTISSRERPRARGAGAPPVGGPQSSPRTHTRVGSGSLQGQQQQYGAGRATAQQANYVQQGQGPAGTHLNTPSALYRNSRSLDSGLDEFGAVPFGVSPPSPQTRLTHAARAQTQTTQVDISVSVDDVGTIMSCRFIAMIL